jgi:uncharacterized sulfatase
MQNWKRTLALIFAITSLGHAKQPNIVLILIDDLGPGWLPPYAERLTPADIEPEVFKRYELKKGKGGAAVSKMKHLEAARKSMPFLGKLAKEGAVFDRCFATAALCAPSRAGLLTGTFQQRWGAYRNIDIDHHGIPAGRIVLAQPLQAAGYRCAMVGKWHVAKNDATIINRVRQEKYTGAELKKKIESSGYKSSADAANHPLNRGFDYYFGFNDSGDKYYESDGLWENDKRVPKRPKGEFLTELFNEKSCAFIDRTLEKKSPFFLYYAPMTLHGGIQPPPKHYSAAFNTGVEFSNIYAGHLLALDKGLEQIFRSLKKHGQLDNTLFLLASDNGCTYYSVPPYNAPFRGGKGTGWLGGLHTPLIVWQPGVVKPGINAELTSLADIMPSVLEAAGTDIPEGIDGKSFMPFLSGKTSKGPRKTLGSSGLQSSRWSFNYHGETNKKDAGDCPLYAWQIKGDKLMVRISETKPGLYKELPDGRPAEALLFNLSEDPQQRHDIRAQHPEEAQQFDTAIHDWLDTMKVPLISQQKDYRFFLQETAK